MELFNSTIGYREACKVRAYEIDSRKEMNVPALVRLMQEAAMQNVIHLKLSVWDLSPQGISWVLHRMRLEVIRMPVLGESIVVYTYPSGFERLFTYRDFCVTTPAGEVLAWSSTRWLLMDTQTRRLKPLPPFILDLADRMPPEDRCLPRPTGDIPDCPAPDFQKDFTVGWHDLDFNHHLNNTHYILFMLESLPSEWLEKKRLKTLDIQYRLEGKLNDPLTASGKMTESNVFVHLLMRQSDGNELAKGKSTWDLH